MYEIRFEIRYSIQPTSLISNHLIQGTASKSARSRKKRQYGKRVWQEGKDLTFCFESSTAVNVIIRRAFSWIHSATIHLIVGTTASIGTIGVRLGILQTLTIHNGISTYQPMIFFHLASCGYNAVISHRWAWHSTQHKFVLYHINVRPPTQQMLHEDDKLRH